MDTIQSGKKKGFEGQVSMFDIGTEQEKEEREKQKYTFKEQDELPEKELLSMEKEMLGIYISGHPLEKLKEQIMHSTNINSLQLREIGEITSENEDKMLEVGGRKSDF